MTDHRRLQRTLFRMQLDPGFAAALAAEEAGAWESTGLAEADRALLRAADPAGVAADPGGKRRTQVLANASSEWTLSLAAAGRTDPGFLQAFARAPELHAAVRTDAPLPFAFARYAARVARERGDGVLAALVALEETLARARRSHRGRDARASGPRPGAPSEGTVRLAPGVALVRLPAGLFAHAEALRSALDRGEAPPPAPPALVAAAGAPDGANGETVAAVPRGSASVHRLLDVHAERLQPPVDLLLARAAEAPLDPGARAAFARAHGADPTALEAFVDELVADGFLARA